MASIIKINIENINTRSNRRKIYIDDNEESCWVNLCTKQYALSRAQIKKYFYITDKIIDKYFPAPSVEIRTFHGNRFKGYELGMVIELISTKKIQEIIQNRITKKTTRKEKKIIDITPENIKQAFYVVNKKAKEFRDKKNNAKNRYNCTLYKRYKTRENYLYKLKDKAVQILIQRGEIDFIGIHKQELGGNTNYLKLYNYNNYYMHIPLVGEPSEDERIIGEIQEKISSVLISKCTISISQAELLLNRFINGNL